MKFAFKALSSPCLSPSVPFLPVLGVQVAGGQDHFPELFEAAGVLGQWDFPAA